MQLPVKEIEWNAVAANYHQNGFGLSMIRRKCLGEPSASTAVSGRPRPPFFDATNAEVGINWRGTDGGSRWCVVFPSRFLEQLKSEPGPRPYLFYYPLRRSLERPGFEIFGSRTQLEGGLITTGS